jgi:hypothetical protein
MAYQALISHAQIVAGIFRVRDKGVSKGGTHIGLITPDFIIELHSAAIAILGALEVQVVTIR